MTSRKFRPMPHHCQQHHIHSLYVHIQIMITHRPFLYKVQEIHINNRLPWTTTHAFTTCTYINANHDNTQTISSTYLPRPFIRLTDPVWEWKSGMKFFLVWVLCIFFYIILPTSNKQLIYGKDWLRDVCLKINSCQWLELSWLLESHSMGSWVQFWP